MTPGLNLKKPKMSLLFFYQGEYRQSAVYFVTGQDIYGLHLRTHITNKNQEQPAIPAVVDEGKKFGKSVNSYQHYYISKGKYREKLQYIFVTHHDMHFMKNDKGAQAQGNSCSRRGQKVGQESQLGVGRANSLASLSIFYCLLVLLFLGHLNMANACTLTLFDLFAQYLP